MADNNLEASTRIATLLEYLHEKKLDLEDMAEQKRTKLEQCVMFKHFETEARQVGQIDIIPDIFLVYPCSPNTSL